MLILNDWHPDILSFISSKRKAGNITNANISVGISDKFMEAVKSDSDWALVFPDTSHSAYNSEWDGDIEQWQDKGYPVITHKTVKAREVWDAIIESAWASAEPGLWFRERANKMSNSYYYPQGKLINTNPCGEQSLPAWGSCNLGAINLSKFTNADKTDVDWYELGQAVRYAVRFLDNVLDLSHYHIQDNEHQSRSERRIGLGIMGLAELLIQLKIKYGSDEGVKLTEEIFKFMTINAYHASSDNALEKGAFEWYDERLLDSGFALQLPDDLRQKIFNQGLRNVTLITVAPTGTTGSLVNTSTGIEPFFAWEYYRKGRLGTYEVEPLDFVRKYQEEHPDEPLPEYFVTAMELTPYEHVRMQASAQKWTDSSISKTVNCPNEWTQAQVDELYMFMYNSGCKGGTIYRDGSRDEQVLYTKKDTDDKSTSNTDTEQSDTLTPTPTISVMSTTGASLVKAKREKILHGNTYQGNTPYGTAFITINELPSGVPYEVFITIGKSGSDLMAQAEALGRSLSISIQHVSEHNRMQLFTEIVNQWSGIGGSRQGGFGANRTRSFPDAIASIIMSQYLNNGNNVDTHAQVIYDTVGTASSFVNYGDWQSATATATPNTFASVISVSLKNADTCPECHETALVRENGCVTCKVCGHSEC